MAKWKVIIPDRVVPPALVEEKIFENNADIVCLNAKENTEMIGKIEDADAILAWHDLHWNSDVLSSLERCKVLVRVGTGFDNVDLSAATSKGISICNLPDYGTNDVADHTLALLLSLARGVVTHNVLSQKGPEFWKWGQTPTFRLTEKKLGIVGLGRIGTAVALRAKSFGMQVGYFDPYLPIGWQKSLGLERYDSLEDLSKSSDIVSLHTPLSSETKDLIGDSFFNNAKSGLILLNTARGPVLNWPAFSKAFLGGKIAGAGFDVLPTEPPDLNDPLISKWIKNEDNLQSRMVVTPHCAFYSQEALTEMRQKAAREALRVLKGEKPQSQVNHLEENL